MNTIEKKKRYVQVKNDNLKQIKIDTFYHLGISTQMKHFNDTFTDIKFVCFSGSQTRVYNIAKRMLNELSIVIPIGYELSNLSQASDRYVMYKAGPILCVNHGIGVSSASVVLHEIIKVLYYSKASDVSFIRIGTSGGLGITPGTVVISSDAVDGCLRPYLEVPILGELVRRPSTLNAELNDKLLQCAEPKDEFKIMLGRTICSWDFYEGQARLDGARCDYDSAKKMSFLKKAYDAGVRNIEMESLCFGTMCSQADIAASVICTTVLNRFEEDQITADEKFLLEWQERPITIVIRCIQKQLSKNNSSSEK